MESEEVTSLIVVDAVGPAAMQDRIHLKARARRAA